MAHDISRGADGDSNVAPYGQGKLMGADSTKPPAGNTPPQFSAQDAMALMQRMWNPFGMPWPGMPVPHAPMSDAPAASNAIPASPPADPGFAGMPFPNPAMMFAALDPLEIERKIAELKIVEGWLAMSLNLMQMSIRTLELQKASLEALRGPVPSGRPKG